MSFDEERLRKLIKGKKNVTGHGKRLVKKVTDGVVVEVKAIQVFVERKVPLETLAAEDIIPDTFNGIPTDVVEIGEVVAGRTKNLCDPLIAGFSVGNKNISAGSFCYPMEKIATGEGPFLTSNAHVLSDTIGPGCTERRILQPGPSDGGTLPEMATLVEYTPLRKAINPFTALWMVVVNVIFRLLGQEQPYDLTDSTPRHLDFGVALPKVGYSLALEVEGMTEWDDFCGVWFASSSLKSFFCKAKYITQYGYQPIGKNVKEAQVGDTVYKGDSRTTEGHAFLVENANVFLWVGYGGLGEKRPLDDVVMCGPGVLGGDSGSSAWLHGVLV